MFIRFKRVKLAAEEYEQPRYSVHCVLVESYRIKGKPRQRVIKYLGSIREQDLNHPAKRHQFIRMIEHRIDGLSFSVKFTSQLKLHFIRKIVRYGRPYR
jgi:hypothetical protein